jgi:hypothetical protein
MIWQANDRLIDHPDVSGVIGPLVSAKTILSGVNSPDTAFYHPLEQEALANMARFVHDRLGRGDAMLGRAGPVCPFARGAVQRQGLVLTAVIARSAGSAMLTRAIARLRNSFASAVGDLDADPLEIFRSIMIVFPHLPLKSISMIERVQKALKPSFVDQGLMIGEFYPGCPAAGLHNEAFRPLDAPVAALAIRHMSLSDAPFLIGDPAQVQNYIRRFGEEGRARIADLRPVRRAQAQPFTMTAVG